MLLVNQKYLKYTAADVLKGVKSLRNAAEKCNNVKSKLEDPVSGKRVEVSRPARNPSRC